MIALLWFACTKPPFQTIPGDVDGDGFADLVLSTGDDLRVYRGGGPQGVWTEPATLLSAPGRVVEGPSTGDVDGDHREDVIVASSDGEGGSNAALLFSGRAVLWERPTETFGLPDGDRVDPVAVAVGDVDGDGYADVAVGAAQGTGLYTPQDSLGQLWFGGPYGLGGPVALLAPASGPAVAGLAALGDVDGDGLCDVAVAARGQIVVYLGGDRTDKRAAQVLDTPGGTPDPQGTIVAAGDVNGDGLSDLVAAEPTTNAGWVWFGTAAGFAASPDVTLITQDAAFGHALAVVDVNGDGAAEIVALTDTHALVYAGADPGAPALVLAGGARIAAGDYDADGFVDVAIDGAVYPGSADGVPEKPIVVIAP